MYKKIISIIIIAVFLYIPTQVFAVDFNITNVEINAFLQADGDVLVEEQHTYKFSGEFGGIIRELIPKKGTKIVQLEAFEGNETLKIETNESEHRIHRPGKDETIMIDLVYEIKNGVDVYADVAEFYWPFFDRSNESTYENLTINVFPPEKATDVIAFGYDEAFQKEKVLEDGHVQFEFGKVPDNRNGDIRVTYDASLFGAVAATNKQMRSEIVAEKQQLIDVAINREEQKKLFASIGSVIIPVFSFFLLHLLFRAWFEAKGKKEALERELNEGGTLPKQTLSLTTTIYFTNHKQLLPETIAAALLDLVRKDHVEKLENNRFRLINRNGLLEHENALVEWLFVEIGTNTEFSFDELLAYTKNEKNHEKYQSKKLEWNKAVQAELKEADLYENKGKYRLTIGFISLILVPFSIIFAINDLFGLFFASLGLFFALFVFAISYVPKTWEGAKIIFEWSKFKQRFPKVSESSWQKLSEDDKMRAFIYGLGINEKSLKEKNESLINAFKHTVGTFGHQSSIVYGIDPTWLIIGAAASSNFRSAETTTAVASTIAGGGAGAGGGGGGSGGF